MKKIRSWLRRKVSKNDTPSGIATPLSTEERTENTGRHQLQYGGDQLQHGGDSDSHQLQHGGDQPQHGGDQLQHGGDSDSHQLQHGGDSDSLLQPPPGKGEAKAKVEEVNPGHVGNDSDSGTGSDVQNTERQQIPSPSSSSFMVMGVASPRIDFDHLLHDHPSALDQITMVINANPLFKKDIKSNPQYWERTFLTSLSVNGRTSYEYYPLLPSTVDGTVNYTENQLGIATSQIWTSRSLFMYQFEGTNQYVIMALNLKSVGQFYLLTVDPDAKDNEPIVSFKSTLGLPKSDSKSGQVFAPHENNDKTGVHLTTQCSDGKYVLIESLHPSTFNSKFESKVVYKALSATKYNNNGLTLSFINPVLV